MARVVFPLLQQILTRQRRPGAGSKFERIVAFTWKGDLEAHILQDSQSQLCRRILIQNHAAKRKRISTADEALNSPRAQPKPVKAVLPAQWQRRHAVLFGTAWLDWNPDQVLRVAAGIRRKQATG